MADFFESLKKTWLKGMEMVGNTASTIATNTKQKVSELTLENRRREILSDFGLLAYDLWQKGEHFPEPLDALLQELSRLDEELNELKAQRYSDNVEETPAEESEAAAEEDGTVSQDMPDVPVIRVPEDTPPAPSAPVPVMEMPKEDEKPNA